MLPDPRVPPGRPFAPEVTVMGVPLPAEDTGPVPLATPVAPAGVPTLRPAEPFYPTVRPPLAVLTAFDDGSPDGETVRLRGDTFKVGRTHGDFLVPHDGRMSPLHIVITREQTGAGWRWTVTDAGGTDGLFIRVSRLQLANGTEFLAGRGRFRFSADPAPALTLHTAEAPVSEVPLVKPELWIGTAPECDIRVTDAFVEPWHARVFLTPGRGWGAQHDKTLNGLWLRVPQVTLTRGGVCFFQIGEQRFRLRAGC